MIRPNRSARNYQFRCNLTGTSSIEEIGPAQGGRVHAVQQITYGEGYVAGVHGIEVALQTEKNDFTSIDAHSAVLTTPWATATTVTGSTFIALESRIEIDDAQLLLTCDGWRLIFSELRWFLNDVLEETITAQDDDGTGCDRRNNSTKCTVTAEFLAHFIGAPACEATRAAQDEWLNLVTNQTTMGWRWWNGSAWVEDDVELDGVNPSSVSCSCEEAYALPGISESGSWDIVLNASARDEVTITDLPNLEGYCAPPFNISPTVCQLWVINYITENKNTWTRATHRAAGIEDHRRQKFNTCDGNTASSDVTSAEPFTYCETHRETTHSEAHNHCLDQIADGDCSGFPPPVCGAGDLLPPDDYACDAQAYVTITWPTADDCCPGQEGPDYDVDPSMRHWRGYLIDGELRLGHAGNVPVSWTDNDPATEVDWVKVVRARSRKEAELFVLYRLTSDGTIYLAKTSNGGTSLSAVATVGAYTQGDFCWTHNAALWVYVLDGSTLKVIVYDSQLSVSRSIFSTDITDCDDLPFRVDDSHGGQGEWRMGVLYPASGTFKFKISNLAGTVYGSTITVGAYPQADFCWARGGGELWIHVNDSGTMKTQVYDLRLNSVRALFSTNIVDMDDQPFRTYDSVGSLGAWRMGVLYINDVGALTFLTSDVPGVNYA